MTVIRPSRGRRNGFTLIELLVVIALILVVASLGVGYALSGQDNQHSTTAANAVTGALLNARQRARHDGLPTGIRILFPLGANLKVNAVGTPVQASQIVLIQQPEDYNAGLCQGVPTASPPLNTLQFTGVDFLGGAAYPGQIDEATVEAGDYFYSPGALPAAPHRISAVSGNPPGVQSITLDSPITSMTAGMQYAIIRGPRRLPSEDVITLGALINGTASMVIDDSTVTIPGSAATTNLCQNLPLRLLVDSNNPNGVQVAEIVFAPSGALIGQGTSADKVLLWLRDPSQPQPSNGTQATVGAPLIVSIQIRTGLISVYPVAAWTVPTDDPYAFAKDGRASGM